MMNPMRTLLVGSSGGHLAQLHQLKPWWERHDRRWVTFEKPDAISLLAGEDTQWAYQPTTRNIPNLLRNLKLSWKVLRDYRPDVVVSTGAGCAFPFFVMAKAMRMKTVYVEVYDRIDSKPLTSKLCYPFSDLFLVQWDEQQKLYPKSQVIGRLF
jgi:UDP-N-acetylglucosamine:LPS N-acetylglucosamine transferase